MIPPAANNHRSPSAIPNPSIQLIAIAGCLESAAIFLFMHGFGSLVAVFLMHIGFSYLIYLRAASVGDVSGKLFCFLASILFFALGPLGAISYLVFTLLLPLFQRSAKTPEENYRSLFPQTPSSREDVLSTEIADMPDDYNLTPTIPFIDIMKHGEYQQKMAVLELISKRFHPDFIPALKEGLRDSSGPVRVMAATVHTRVVNYFMEGTIRFQNRLSNQSTSVEWLEAARHYGRYAESGLLDSDQTQQTRAEALRCYRKFMQMTTILNAEVAAEIGLILIRCGDFEQAECWLKEQLKEVGSNRKLLILYFESLYSQEKYDQLQKAVLKHGDILCEQKGCSWAIKEMNRFWAHL